MNIVGVCGRASSGKDTVATHLVKHHHFKHMLLASPIKEFAQQVFGFSDDHLYGPSHWREKKISVDRDRVNERLEQYGPYWLRTIGHPEAYTLLDGAIDAIFEFHVKRGQLNARVTLQYLGTEFGRQCLDQDVWVHAFLTKAQECLAFHDFHGVVLSDVRFLNEVDAIKHVGGRLIRLLRNSTVPIPGITNHVSELEQASIPIAEFDCIINNTETLSDLYRNVDTFLRCNHNHLPLPQQLASEELYE